MTTISRPSSPLFSSITYDVTAGAADESSSWPELEALLERACKENKTSRIDPDKVDEINQLITHISSTSSLNEQIALLKLLENFTFFYTSKFFSVVLNEIATLHPEIREYFSLENPIITPKGISRILHHFESEYKFSRDCLSCQNVSDLPRLLEEILRSEESYIMKGFVIANPPEDPHLTPIFILKTGEKVNVFSSDSKGHEISSEKHIWDMCEALKILIKTFRGRSDYFENLKIYSCKLQRQRDGVSCPIFSTLDLKTLVERHTSTEETIFEFFERYSEPKFIMHEIMDDSDLPLFEIDLLPPELMKVTQSYTALATYTAHSPKLEGGMTPCFIRKSPDGSPVFQFQTMEVLQRAVLSSKCISPVSRPESKYVDRKRWSFIIQILESHFKDRGLL